MPKGQPFPPLASGPSLAGLVSQFRCTSHLQPGPFLLCMHALPILRVAPVLTVGSVGVLHRGYAGFGPLRQVVALFDKERDAALGDLVVRFGAQKVLRPRLRYLFYRFVYVQ
jgi:hypothetical protein